VSYSRWSNSNWYTFWNSNSGETKENQILSLWHVSDDCSDFTFDQLEQFNLSVMKTIFPKISEEDLLEGLEYIDQFLGDVNDDFLGDDLK